MGDENMRLNFEPNYELRMPKIQMPEGYKKTLLFISLSGSHVYSTPNINSDIDLRGVHVEKTKDIYKLHPPGDTVERTIGNFDIVTHEVSKYLTLLIKNNGNMYEWICSPVITSFDDEFVSDVKEIADKALSKIIYNHYYGLAEHMHHHSNVFDKNFEKHVMYMFRSLLCGIHVLESKEFILNFEELCSIYDFKLNINDLPKLRTQSDELFDRLDSAKMNSKLKDTPTVIDEIRANELLLKIRKKHDTK